MIFIILLQALSQGFRVECPWDLLYTHDLVLISESMEELIGKFTRCKEGIELEFQVKVGVHQGSVLNPLIFIILLQALSQGFRVECPWELLYAHDLVLISEGLWRS